MQLVCGERLQSAFYEFKSCVLLSKSCAVFCRYNRAKGCFHVARQSGKTDSQEGKHHLDTNRAELLELFPGIILNSFLSGSSS